jgi:hypothetical protein
MLILQLAGWLVLSCVLMSFIEHQVHARLMHRRNYFSDRSAKYKRVFEAHAMVHHKHYSKIFSDEPVPVGEDQEIRLTVRGTHLRRDTVIPQWFRASKAAAASDGHAVHC